jgi:aspartate aminotransferase
MLLHTPTIIPEDPIFGIVSAFQKDPRPEKINLSIGIYQNESSQTPILQCVREAEQRVLKEEFSKSYLPIEGNPSFIESTAEVIFGKNLWTDLRSLSCGFQTIGGTGALRLGTDFLRKEISHHIAIGKPTWPNHTNIFSHGDFHQHEYAYYKNQQPSLENLKEIVQSLPPRSIILLHACCHNPSGLDYNQEEWKEIFSLISSHSLIPFFDMAYQGFGEDLEEDAWPIRYFAKQGYEMLVAMSFAKNLSFYGERGGALYIVSRSPSLANQIKGIVKNRIRGLYSNPPIHSGIVIASILSSAHLKELWVEELKSMAQRIRHLRLQFSALLTENTGLNFNFLENGKGLFSLFNVNKEEVLFLKEKHAIYIAGDGRVNLTGLNETNMERVAKSLSEILSSKKT